MSWHPIFVWHSIWHSNWHSDILCGILSDNLCGGLTWILTFNVTHFIWYRLRVRPRRLARRTGDTARHRGRGEEIYGESFWRELWPVDRRSLWLDVGMDRYLLISFLVGWTSINPSCFDVNYRGTIGFDTLPCILERSLHCIRSLR